MQASDIKQWGCSNLSEKHPERRLRAEDVRAQVNPVAHPSGEG